MLFLCVIGGVSLFTVGFSFVSYINTREYVTRRKTLREVLELIKSEPEYPTPWAKEAKDRMFKDLTEHGPDAMQIFAQVAVRETKKSLVKKLVPLLQEDGFPAKQKQSAESDVKRMN